MATTTITYTAAEGNRFAVSLGEQLGLTNPDETPRSATAQECKDWFIAQMKGVVLNKERAKARAAAEAAIVISPFNPT